MNLSKGRCVKRLNTPEWVKFDLDHEIQINEQARILGRRALQIDPVFFKDGWYYDRFGNHTWIEFGGRAWAYDDVEYFKFELNTYHNRLPRQRVIAALETLELESALSAQQREELERWRVHLFLREGRLAVARAMKRDRHFTNV